MLELFSLEKRRLGGNFVSVYKELVGSSKEAIATLFPLVSSDRKRGSGHKLKGEIPLKYAKQLFFAIKMIECWHRLPIEIVESPSGRCSKPNQTQS